MAMEKAANTTVTQIAFAVLEFAVEMCTKPWIVEVSKNSRNFVKAIFLKFLNVFSLR